MGKHAFDVRLQEIVWILRESQGLVIGHEIFRAIVEPDTHASATGFFVNPNVIYFFQNAELTIVDLHLLSGKIVDSEGFSTIVKSCRSDSFCLHISPSSISFTSILRSLRLTFPDNVNIPGISTFATKR